MRIAIADWMQPPIIQLVGEQEQQRVLARATITPGREAGCLCTAVEIRGQAEAKRQVAEV